MAGEISKEIVNRIREDMGDTSMSIVKTDTTLYRKLTNSQRFLLSSGIIKLKAKLEIPLVLGTLTYQMDETVWKVVGVTFSDGVYANVIIDGKNIILSDETFTESGVMYVDVFLKPSQGGKDKITETQDPILPREYDEVLANMVKSEYRHLFKEFESKETVMQEAARISARQLNMNRIYQINPLRRLW